MCDMKDVSHKNTIEMTNYYLMNVELVSSPDDKTKPKLFSQRCFWLPYQCDQRVVLLHSKYHIVSLVQNFTKMCPDSSEENFCGFYFHEMNMWHSDHTPYQLMAMPHNAHVNQKMKKWKPSLWFCVEAFTIRECCFGQETGLLNRRIQDRWLTPPTTLECLLWFVGFLCM